MIFNGMPSEFKVDWNPSYFYLSGLEDSEANRALWIFGALGVAKNLRATGRLSEVNWHSRIQPDNRIRWVSAGFGSNDLNRKRLRLGFRLVRTAFLCALRGSNPRPMD